VAKNNERVTIIQRVLPHYRVPFFRRLYWRLQERGSDLQLIYGQERLGTVPQSVMLDEPWAHRIENRYAQLGRIELVWQPCVRLTHGSALVVVEQSSRLIVNYLLLALARIRLERYKFAFWGHGRNMQTDKPGSWSERIKQRTLEQADWWFAYTELSASIAASHGYPCSRITTVQNAIDTTELRANLNACTEGEVLAVKERHGITGDTIGLYCGGMYELKKLSFLIDACVAIRKSVPGFSAVFVGDGPERQRVAEAAHHHHWIHYVGPQFGRNLAPFYRMSNALLMPGLVGLAIVDSFVAGVPMFTTDLPIHSPEIAYLQSGINGVMTPHTVEAYAAAVGKYIVDADAQRLLQDGCRRSAVKYTIEQMVENFCVGIAGCLRRNPDNYAA
jgi:glycosyltransferase involved in cell wall biosynthesis